MNMFENVITTGDARELAKYIPDESIDLIFTDPPYSKEYLGLYDWLSQEAYRVLKPSGFLLTYAGTSYLPSVLARLSEHLVYHWQYMSMESGPSILVHPRRILASYKPILSFVKGNGKPNHYMSDLWTSPMRDKRFHRWGQSEATARYFIEAFSSDNDVIWEPFCGGGTTPSICKALHRNFIAFEIDSDTADIARRRLETVQPFLLEETTEQLSLEVSI